MTTRAGRSTSNALPPAAAHGRGKAPARVQVAWAGEHRFDAGRAGGPVLRLDGSGETGQSPVDAVLSALAACASVDVVDILAKRRTPITSLTVDVTGERADAVPARLTRVTLAYRIGGDGVERAQVERAVELAVTKYCSVRDSLTKEIIVDWTVTLDGESRAGR